MQLTKAQQYRAKVSEKYYLTESKKYLLVRLEFVNPELMEFAAGQYVSIKVNERGERRSYSMVSTPDVTHGVTLVAEMIEGGKGTEFLRGAETGGEVEVLGPLGRFFIEGNTQLETRNTKLLFVATGAGITPIRCMIEDLLINKHYLGPVRLHWGMRSEEDMFWFDNFMRLSEEHPNFVFDQVLSAPSTEWELCAGHVQDCLSRDFAGGELAGWEAFVCGNPKTVASIEAKLVEMGMEKERVHHEKFT